MTREQLRLSQKRSASQTADIWKAQLRDLLHDCAAIAPAEQGDRIHEAWSLLRQGAAGLRPPLASALDRQALEAMLALGAHESAVLALVGDDTAFMLSRGANGNCLASAVLPDGSEEMVAEASTLALALLAAFLSSLHADSAIFADRPVMFPANTGVRLN